MATIKSVNSIMALISKYFTAINDVETRIKIMTDNSYGAYSQSQ